MASPRLTALSRFVTTCLSLIAFALVVGMSPLRMLLMLTRTRTLSYWTGTPILTLPLKARAERLLGVEAKSLVLQTTFISDRFDINLSHWRSLPFLGRFVPYLVFVWICLRANRLHSFVDRGLLPPTRHLQYNDLELAAYRVLGIEVYLWAYGADVRRQDTTRALGEPNCCTDCRAVGRACICDGQIGRRYMASVARRVRAVFSMGDMIEYTDNAVTSAYYWPVDLDADGGKRYAARFPELDSTKPLRVVHAPNHRDLKGTKYLESAIDRLRAAGVPIELVLVEGVSNLDALEIYRRGDVVFDQCLIGFHGYFSLEAMALGKPVLCFIRKEAYLLAPDECPMVRITMLDIGATLKRLAEDRTLVHSLGRQGRAYVEKHYTIEAFSRRLADSYRSLEHSGKAVGTDN